MLQNIQIFVNKGLRIIWIQWPETISKEALRERTNQEQIEHQIRKPIQHNTSQDKRSRETFKTKGKGGRTRNTWCRKVEAEVTKAGNSGKRCNAKRSQLQFGDTVLVRQHRKIRLSYLISPLISFSYNAECSVFKGKA